VLYRKEELTERKATQQVLVLVLEKALQLLHPFVPHITEELWQQLPREPGNGESIMVSSFPEPGPRDDIDDPAAEESMGLLQEVTVAVRTIRSETNIPPGARIAITIIAPEDRARATLSEYGHYISTLARLSHIELMAEGERPAGSAAAVVQGMEIFVPLAGLVDFDEEIQRLTKAIAKLEADRKKIQAKLGNPKFLERAPAEIVDKEKGRLEELEEKLGKLMNNMDRLRESRG